MGYVFRCKNWKPITNPHKYDGERVVIGSVTDGYNPYEEEFHRTRRLLEELRGSDAEIMICTKSDLVLRLIWLENLNLRGQFKGGIMTYIREKYPDLIPLYEEIYNKKGLNTGRHWSRTFQITPRSRASRIV